MEKRIAYSLYEFSILIYFVSFTKISSSASESAPKSIVQTMISDSDLCSLPPVMYENDIIRNCSTLKYPDNNITLTGNNRNIFLCLVFYDTWYKICRSNTSNQISSENIKFKSYIQKFFPEKDHITMFCENIKNVTFSYKKLEPLLSLIHFNKPPVCYFMCYDIKEEFNPLCAILAWSKSIDENIKSSSKTEKTQSQHLTKNMGVQQSKTLTSDLNKTTDATTTKSNNGQQTKQSAVKPSLPNSEQKLPQINENNKSTKFEPVDIKKHVSEDLPKAPENINTDDINSVEKNKNKTSTILKQVQVQDIKDNTLQQVQDIKTSTISENTQDHENSANQEDWSRIDNEKSPYDPDDGLDHPLDTADQNQNEPPEQKDIISRYHSTRSDEESHFFTYFTLVFLVSIAAYIGYHNKQKILAIVLEGRRSRNNRGRRRPSTANYRKLDCTLEEAVTSQCNANVTHVIY